MKVKMICMILAGGVLQGLGMSLFLFPHDIPSGGAAGVAVLFNYLFHIPHGISVWAVNVSMLFTALKWLEMRTFVGTLASITVTSVSVLIFDSAFPDVAANLWLDLAGGSLLLGLGIGLLYKYKISNGGFGALALMVSIYRGGNPGNILLAINCVIFLITASIIAWAIVFQALICQLISTRVIDVIYQIRFASLPLLTPMYRKK
ncbi:YitT family protein [Bacillus atrophaeus]|uniref:YitT family protein n=1 Tax=Bacillus atrophaeus TaxID=1452 RepID=UPI002E1F83D9|nr:YitT family protein [Bacillus atrophaeus]